MSKSIDSIGSIKVLVATLFLAVAGCEELPSLPMPPVASVDSDVVTETGRGGYHWRLNGPYFEVVRPTAFQLVDKVSPKIIERNLVRSKSEAKQPWSKPDGMDEDVHSFFRRFVEPQPEPRLLMELERSDEVGVDTVCFNRQGTRLLTVAKKVIEWDVQSGKQLRAFDAPVANCKEVFYDPDQQTALVHNGETLARIALVDGQLLHSWKPPKGRIESVQNAREADAQAVVTDDSQVFALADNFQQVTEYQDKKFTSRRISINPKGLWILGVADGAAARWRLDQPGKPTEVMSVEQLEEATCVPMAGAYLDRWADTRVIHEFQGTHEWLKEAYRYPCLMPNAYMLVVGNATVDGTQDWMIILGEKYDSEGKPSRFVQDLRFDAFEYSEPWPIPVSAFQKLSCDATWERLGFLVGNQLRVFERRRWVDPTGYATAERVGFLLAQGRIDQLELCAKELRAVPVHLNGRHGEDMYEEVVQQVASQWARLESEPASDDIMQAIAKWHEAGSELALLASAERHVIIGAVARGGGSADTVTQQGWNTLSDRTGRAFGEIKQLLEQGNVSPTAVYEFIQCARYGEANYGEAEPWLIQTTESHPDDAKPLGAMCYWLLPRWGGAEGEAGALAAALAARYPAPDGDLLYARAAMAIAQLFGAQPLQYEAGFSVPKILDAVEPMLASGSASRLEIELLMEIAQHGQKRDLVKRLAEYHIQHFGMPTHHAYQHNLLVVLFDAREATLEKKLANQP